MSVESKEKQPKVYWMGEEIPHEQLPDAREADMEYHFKPVILSGAALDRASQIVPDEYWKPLGLHTWLSGRANLAFSKLPISADKLEVRVGRLLYRFEFTPEGPALKTVMLA